MKYIINIQSVSDIITNSSSETFTINTDASVGLVREWFNNVLRNWGYSNQQIERDSSIGGCIYERNGKIHIDYDIICNVDESIYDVLTKAFGENNVESEYF